MCVDVPNLQLDMWLFIRKRKSFVLPVDEVFPLPSKIHVAHAEKGHVEMWANDLGMKRCPAIALNVKGKVMAGGESNI